MMHVVHDSVPARQVLTERSLKIAVLNPYSGPVAEVESCQWLSLAAESLGHEAIICHDERDIQDCNPDFVLNLSFQNPKLTRHPTYGLLNLPTSILTSAPRFIRNCLTYDAAFVLAPSVAKWYSDLCISVSKPVNVLPFAFTTHAVSFEGVVDFGTASIAYGGTNWDGLRLKDVFEILAPTGDISFYGPPEKWLHVDQRSVKGLVPFDGESLLRVYRKHGVGLALAHPQFVAEQIPHNRIFEVAASGAICISSDFPLVRGWFGDSFLYVDQTREPRQVADDILAHLRWVRQNPESAAEKARAAHKIFREKFAMDRFLASAIDYHKDILIKKHFVTRTRDTQDPSIDVVVRAGEGSLEALGRALDSLAAQTCSRITALLVVDGRPAGLETLLTRYRNILDVRVIDGPGGNRSLALLTGLRQVDADYFTVMDTADEYYPNHFALLLDRINDLRHAKSREVKFVYSGGVQQCKNRALYEHAKWRDNPQFFGPHYIRIQNFGAMEPEALKELQTGRNVLGHAWLASRDLLDDEILSNPGLAGGEDSHLPLRLLEKTAPEFNYEITACEHVDAEHSARADLAPAGVARPHSPSLAQRLRGLWGAVRYGLPPDFDPQEYLRLNPDVAQAKADPVKHFREHGRQEGRRWR